MNTQSFEQKYLQLTPRLYSVAFSVLGNAEDAEDAVQETFARLWEKRNELERMENAEGYFMTTLRHISLNMLRNRRAAADIAEAHNALTDIDAATAQAEMEHRETHGLLKRLLARPLPAVAPRCGPAPRWRMQFPRHGRDYGGNGGEPENDSLPRPPTIAGGLRRGNETRIIQRPQH